MNLNVERKYKKVKVGFFAIITALAIISTFSIELQSASINTKGNISEIALISRNFRQSLFYLPLNDHGPIFIENNSDLISQAAIKGWSGDGTFFSPYLINGLNVSGSTDLITVKNTDLFFQINNCSISNGNGNGIVLSNVTNGAIVNSIISSNPKSGILLDGQSGWSLSNISIENNSIFSNGKNGVILRSDDNTHPVTHCLITNNNISYNTNHGIILEAFCHNNIISNNKIFKNSEIGIYLDDFNNNNNITGNTIYQNSLGIDLDDSLNSTITKNYVFNNSDHGIMVAESDYGNDIGIFVTTGISIIRNNTVHRNGGGGITIEHTFRNRDIQYFDIVDDNIIFDGEGIDLYSTQHSMITNNMIYNVSGDGIYGTTNHSTYSNNFIYNSGDHGIELATSINNTIINNTFYNNNHYGLLLRSTSKNHIQWNDFIGNSKAEAAQAQDDYFSSEITNLFTHNFWYDLPKFPDPYVIDVYLTKGTPNQDSNPLMHPNKPFHFLARPRIFFPIADDPTYPGRVILKWVHAVDFFNHSVSYSVYYSTNKGDSWRLIISNWSDNSYSWTPTSNIGLMRDLIIKVVARCSDGLTAEDITDNAYSLITYTDPPAKGLHSCQLLILIPQIIIIIIFWRKTHR